VILYKANCYIYTALFVKSPSFLGKYFGIKGDTLYFSPSISAGIQKKNVPLDSKSPSFLEEKFLVVGKRKAGRKGKR